MLLFVRVLLSMLGSWMGSAVLSEAKSSLLLWLPEFGVLLALLGVAASVASVGPKATASAAAAASSHATPLDWRCLMNRCIPRFATDATLLNQLLLLIALDAAASPAAAYVAAAPAGCKCSLSIR
jgi:hypothetical protein